MHVAKSFISQGIKMRKLQFIILLFFNCFMAMGQDAITINHLPFIQGLTDLDNRQTRHWLG